MCYFIADFSTPLATPALEDGTLSAESVSGSSFACQALDKRKTPSSPKYSTKIRHSCKYDSMKTKSWMLFSSL